MIKYKKVLVSPGRHLEEIEKDIAGAANFEGIELTGDDPLTRLDLFDIASKARAAGHKRVKVMTGGRRLGDISFVERLIQAGIHLFEIELTSYTPELAQSLVNIRSFDSYGDPSFSPYLAVRIKITRENFQHLSDIVRMILPYRIDRIVLSFDDYDLRMSEAMPYIKMAMETSLLNQVWVFTKGIPLCLLVGYEHHVSEIYLSDDRQRGQNGTCKSCVYAGSCEGIAREYSAQHGFDEFNAVSQSPYTEEIKGLRR